MTTATASSKPRERVQTSSARNASARASTPTGARRHGQDRPSRGGTAHGARLAGAHRLTLRRAALRLGEPSHLGAGARGRGAGYVTYSPGSGRPGAGRDGAVIVAPRGRERGAAVGAALRPGRGGGAACRAGGAGLRPGVDDRARELVRQNFSENYLLDAVLAGEVVLPAGDVGGAVRRRRRHRRCRGRGADRGRGTLARSTR